MLTCCMCPSSNCLCHLFLYYLGKIGSNQLAIYGGGGEKYFISNVPRDSWGFEGRVAYTFLLRISSSKFLLLLFSLSSGFFPPVSTVCFLHDVTLQKSLISILYHFPEVISFQGPWTQGCVYARLYCICRAVEEFHNSLAKQQSNVKYLRMCS